VVRIPSPWPSFFNDEFLASHREIKNAKFVKINNLTSDLPAESFDYVVGTAILCHDLYPQNLHAIQRLLKPGGQILFFEANYWNPQVWLKSAIPPLGRWAGNASCQVALRKYRLLRIASQQGFVDIDIIPYDIIHPLTPRFLLRFLQSLAFVMEHAPVVKELCGTLYVWARKPGDVQARRPNVCLAEHAELEGWQHPFTRDRYTSLADSNLPWLPLIGMILAGRADVNNAWRTAVWTDALVTMGTVCLIKRAPMWTDALLHHCPFFLAMAGDSLQFGFGLVAVGKNGWNLIGISTVIGAIVLCCVPELLLGKYRNAKAHVEQSSAVRGNK
jgi:SAM-dependent methyltransferase